MRSSAWAPNPRENETITGQLPQPLFDQNLTEVHHNLNLNLVLLLRNQTQAQEGRRRWSSLICLWNPHGITMMRMMTRELDFTWHFCQEMSEELHVIREHQGFAGRTPACCPASLLQANLWIWRFQGSYSHIFSSSKLLVQVFTRGWTSFYCCSSQGWTFGCWQIPEPRWIPPSAQHSSAHGTGSNPTGKPQPQLIPGSQHNSESSNSSIFIFSSPWSVQVNYLLGRGGNGLSCFLSVPFLVGIMTDKTQRNVWRLSSVT